MMTSTELLAQLQAEEELIDFDLKQSFDTPMTSSESSSSSSSSSNNSGDVFMSDSSDTLESLNSYFQRANEEKIVSDRLNAEKQLLNTRQMLSKHNIFHILREREIGNTPFNKKNKSMKWITIEANDINRPSTDFSSLDKEQQKSFRKKLDQEELEKRKEAKKRGVKRNREEREELRAQRNHDQNNDQNNDQNMTDVNDAKENIAVSTARMDKRLKSLLNSKPNGKQ